MATILDLLMALNRGDLPPLPDPARPIPLMPLRLPDAPEFMTNPEPEMPPAAPMPALDMGFVNQYAGAQPSAPAPLSRGQRIANALAGFGAGFQGRGGEFLEQLREPQREYQRQLERYEGRRTAGLELAERRAEREADRANRAAELSYDREYKTWLKKYGVREGAAAKQAEYAFELLRDARKFDADRREQERKERAAKEKQRNDIVSKLVGQDFAPTKFANEIADAIVFGKPLSAAAEKWRSIKARKLEAQLANIGGGGGGTGPVMAKLQNGQLVPLSAVNKDVGGVMLGGEIVPVVEYVGGRIPRQPQQPQAQAAPTLNLFSEFSGGLLPGAPQQPSEQDVRAYAKKFKMSREKARKELMGR